jgi:hypothetical protein
MALVAGSVTVNPDGTHSGSGLALAMYEAHKAAYEADPFGASFVATLPVADLATTFRIFSLTANAYAAGIVSHLLANAVISTTVSAGGLQKTPNPNNADTATAAPAAPVVLTGTIA